MQSSGALSLSKPGGKASGTEVGSYGLQKPIVKVSATEHTGTLVRNIYTVETSQQ